MSLPWTPRVVVGDLDYVFSFPMRPPGFPQNSVGGSEDAAETASASYEVRHDYLLEVPLRFFEYERSEVVELIRAMQTHFDPIDFYADQNQGEPDNQCRIVSPARGERWKPTRSGEFPSMFELTITLRSITGPWEILYFTDVLES